MALEVSTSSTVNHETVGLKILLDLTTGADSNGSHPRQPSKLSAS
jgi:hypothetical protein